MTTTNETTNETNAESTPQSALPANFDSQGHRGARGLKPENTLPAFETALDLGVTTLELDLHFSSDGELVVWHDPAIDKEKCGLAPGADGVPDPDSLIAHGRALMISSLTLAELGAFRCDRNPDGNRFPEQDNGPTALAGDDYSIVSLQALFDFVEAYAQSEDKSAAQRENAAKVQFNVETKRVPSEPRNINDGFDGVVPGAFEEAVLRLVIERGLTDRVIVQSFDHRSLWAMRSVNTDIRLAALTSRNERAQPAEFAAQEADIWSPDYRSLTPALLGEAHEAGLLVIPWTVNEVDEMQRLIDMGVDGIISDRPDLLLSLP